MAKLLDGVQNDATGASFAANNPARRIRGTAYVAGTFDSGTVKVEVSPDNGTTWFTADDAFGSAATATSNGIIRIDTNATRVRGVLTGTNNDGTASIDAWFLDDREDALIEAV